MSSFDVTSTYYSGQGVVLVGVRDSIYGTPKGMLPIGNVTDLKITIENTTKEHKESQTGQRGIDKRLVLETKCGLQMTVEHYDYTNLSRALRATPTYRVPKTGNTYTEAAEGFLGKVSAFARVGWTDYEIYAHSVATANKLDAYDSLSEATTAWDYKFNPDAGSFWLNDGKPDFTKITAGGRTVASIDITTTDGAAVIVLNGADSKAEADDYAVFLGFTGTDAGLINGIVKKITNVVHKDVAESIPLTVTVTGAWGTTSAITVGTTAPRSFIDYDPIIIKGNYKRQVQMDALVVAPQEFWLRFEGLNTAQDNEPVVVEVFRFAVDPLKELLMISDDLQQFVLEGNVLADSSRASGSKYFREIMTAVNPTTGPTGPTWA